MLAVATNHKRNVFIIDDMIKKNWEMPIVFFLKHYSIIQWLMFKFVLYKLRKISIPKK